MEWLLAPLASGVVGALGVFYGGKVERGKVADAAEQLVHREAVALLQGARVMAAELTNTNDELGLADLMGPTPGASRRHGAPSWGKYRPVLTTYLSSAEADVLSIALNEVNRVDADLDSHAVKEALRVLPKAIAVLEPCREMDGAIAAVRKVYEPLMKVLKR